MRRFSIGLLALCFAVALTSSASAGILSSYLSFDGGVGTVPNSRDAGEDQMNDESRASVADEDSSGAGFTNGDIIFGMITLSDITRSGPEVNQTINEQITLVFAGKISGTAPGNALSLVPVADVGNAHDLRNLLDVAIQPVGFSDWDDAVFAVVTNPSTAEADDPINFNKATAELELAEMSVANGWSLEAIGGFDPSGTNQHGDADYFNFKVLNSSPFIGGEAGGFTVLYHVFGSSTRFLPVSTQDFDGNVTSHDVIIHSGLTSVTPTEDDPWDYENNSVFLINAVPEPTTLTLAGLGVALFGFAGYRRRRKDQQAA